MLRSTKARVSIVATAAALALGIAGPASAQTTQDGLVNVNLEDVTVQVPVALAADLCDLNVGVLSRQERLGGATCTATAESIASPGTGGVGRTNQDGLVNVNLEDVTVLVPIALAANLCDLNVGVLSRQERRGGAMCTATAESLASPGNGGGGSTTQDGLVNVNVRGLTVLLPIAVAANVCDVNVGVLSRQERRGGATCRAAAESIARSGSGGGGSTRQDGLVNVNVQDVALLVPVALAANVCDANVGVLSRLERRAGATCTATAESIATRGNGSGGGQVSQDGLVNVNVSGLDVLVPIAIAANVCDVNVGVLSRLERRGGATCTATAESIATRGNGGGGGQVSQDGLVNVNVSGVGVLVPIAIAANVCDVNVGVLSRLERLGGATCTATAESIASPGSSGGLPALPALPAI